MGANIRMDMHRATTHYRDKEDLLKNSVLRRRKRTSCCVIVRICTAIIDVVIKPEESRVGEIPLSSDTSKSLMAL